MPALSSYEANVLLNASLRTDANYLALFTTNPTWQGTGTEASGGGYARKAITFNAATEVSNARQVINSADIDFGTMSANIGTITHWGIYDAASGGNLLWYGVFTLSKAVETGDAVEIKAGEIKISLS
jgi:hypothetical protein